MATPVVRTELRVDDLATTTLSKIKDGFGSLEKAAGGVTHQIVDFAKQTAAIAVGTNLTSFIQKMRDVSTLSVRTAMDSQNEMRRLMRASAEMSTSKGGYVTFNDQAKETFKTLTQVSNQSGVARDELVKAFEDGAASSHKTREQMTKLVSDIASSTKATGLSVSDVVQGFKEIETNTISANNPIITMAKQANIVRGHSEQIALKWQYMGRAKLFEKGQDALKILNERAKRIPPTLEEMTTKLNNVRTDTLKLVGEPMLRAIMPAMERFAAYIENNQDKIAGFAHMVGEKAGEWITEAANKISDGFQYVQTHAQEIRDAIVGAWEYAKGVVEFIIRHKESIAAIYLGSKAAPLLGMGGQAVGGLARIGALGPQFQALFTGAATGMSGFTAALTSALGPLALLAGSVAAVSVAMKGYDEVLAQRRGHLDAAAGGAERNLERERDVYERMRHTGMLTTTDTNQFTRADAERNLRANMTIAGKSSAEIRREIDRMESAFATHEVLKAKADPFKAAARDASGAKLAAEGDEEAVSAAYEKSARAFADAFKDVQLGGDELNQDANKTVVDIISGSSHLREAILQFGSSFGLDMTKLTQLVGDKAGDFTKKVQEVQKLEERKTGGKGKVGDNIFNHNTFTIKQDFRDQDPDRIAVVFRDSIARAAVARVQAGTSLFGGGSTSGGG